MGKVTRERHRAGFIKARVSRETIRQLREHVLDHGCPLGLPAGVARWGCPLAFYSDRHGIFRINAKDALTGDGKTEFARVAERLEITPILALPRQAKGRVEPANQALQDRQAKEMRLERISSMAAANGLLPSFIAG